MAWAGAQFFWLEVPVESSSAEKHHMLYTTTSAQVLAWSEDPERNQNMTRLLVPVVPKGAAVKLTTAQAVVTKYIYTSHRIARAKGFDHFAKVFGHFVPQLTCVVPQPTLVPHTYF